MKNKEKSLIFMALGVIFAGLGFACFVVGVLFNVPVEIADKLNIGFAVGYLIGAFLWLISIYYQKKI